MFDPLDAGEIKRRCLCCQQMRVYSGVAPCQQAKYRKSEPLIRLGNPVQPICIQNPLSLDKPSFT